MQTDPIGSRTRDLAFQSVCEVTQLLTSASEPRAVLPRALGRLCDLMQLDDADHLLGGKPVERLVVEGW